MDGLKQRIKTPRFVFPGELLCEVEHWSRRGGSLETGSCDMEKPRADTIRTCSIYQKLKEKLKSADKTIQFLFLRKFRNDNQL